MATARFDVPIASLLFEVCVWASIIAALETLPATTASAALLFVVITVLTYLVGRRFQSPNARPKRKEGFRLLLQQAGLAGLLVAVVTASAAKLGLSSLACCWPSLLDTP